MPKSARVTFAEAQLTCRPSDGSVRGWLTGWVSAHSVAIRLATGDAFYTPRPMSTVRLLPIARDRLALLEVTGDHQTVRVYALPHDTEYLQSLGFQPSR
jgi:hypothetical protein